MPPYEIRITKQAKKEIEQLIPNCAKNYAPFSWRSSRRTRSVPDGIPTQSVGMRLITNNQYTHNLLRRIHYDLFHP